MLVSTSPVRSPTRRPNDRGGVVSRRCLAGFFPMCPNTLLHTRCPTPLLQTCPGPAGRQLPIYSLMLQKSKASRTLASPLIRTCLNIGGPLFSQPQMTFRTQPTIEPQPLPPAVPCRTSHRTTMKPPIRPCCHRLTSARPFSHRREWLFYDFRPCHPLHSR